MVVGWGVLGNEFGLVLDTLNLQCLWAYLQVIRYIDWELKIRTIEALGLVVANVLAVIKDVRMFNYRQIGWLEEPKVSMVPWSFSLIFFFSCYLERIPV